MQRPFFVHCSAAPGRAWVSATAPVRVNATIAVLQAIARVHGCTGLSLDMDYPGRAIPEHERFDAVERILTERIEQSLCAGDEPMVFCTVTAYNAPLSVLLLTRLKQTFGRRLRVGVGGQLIRTNPAAWIAQPFLDHIGVGDAEEILPAFLNGTARALERYRIVTSEHHYAPPCYDGYVALHDRLDAMSEYSFGSYHGVRLLATESVRGCSWAYTSGRACRFCSLQGVDAQPVFRSLDEHFRIERELVTRYGATWIFDVSNQWLPVQGPRAQVEWLRCYCAARERFGGTFPHRYVYLTTNSVTEETAPLLRRAGIAMAFVGIDGWDPATRDDHHKTTTDPSRMLAAARNVGLLVRSSLVIGPRTKRKSLLALEPTIRDLRREFSETIIRLDCVSEELIPGSEAWASFEERAATGSLPAAYDLFRSFRSKGYLTNEETDALNQLAFVAGQTPDGISFEEATEAVHSAADHGEGELPSS